MMGARTEIDSGWSLRRFAEWYVGDGDALRIDMAGENALRVHDDFSELVLFTHAPFRATLVVLFPGYRVPPHIHEHVDSYNLSLTGEGEAFVGGRRWIKRVQTRPRVDLRIPVLANVVHHGYTESGSVFLSLQKWHNGIPGFLSEDWVNAGNP